jgi:hypothetical protein
MKQALSAQTQPKSGRGICQLVTCSIMLSAVLLSGCAQVNTVQPGTPAKDMIAKFGKPAVSCILKDGSKRIVYTSQPAGEQAWASAVTPDGKVAGFVQVLTDDQFSVLGSGTWTADAVRCQFGPPAEVETLGWGDNQRTVWSYHYMQNPTYYALMNISFDVDTHKVIRFGSEVDPTRDPTVAGFSN